MRGRQNRFRLQLRDAGRAGSDDGSAAAHRLAASYDHIVGAPRDGGPDRAGAALGGILPAYGRRSSGVRR
jgi:hypothetical protein